MPFILHLLPRPSGVAQSAVPDSKLVIIQKNLYALKDLLDKNPHLFHSSPGDSTAARAPALEQEAWKVGCFYSHIVRHIVNSFP